MRRLSRLSEEAAGPRRINIEKTIGVYSCSRLYEKTAGRTASGSHADMR
jgi:hypothetical protein